MAFTWRHLIGSTDRFAIEVSLIPDPDGADDSAPDLVASWGEFKIFVEGKNLCEARDSTGIVIEGVRWYLLPVLRFFVLNWEPLLHQGRLPHISRRGTTAATQMASTHLPPASLSGEAADKWSDAWWRYYTGHALASARDGGIFPNIWFRRQLDDIEVSWDNNSNPAEPPLRFLDRSGAALVEAREFAEVVGGIVRSTFEELGRRVTSTELAELGKALASIGAPGSERRWLRHALLLDLRRDVDEAVTVVKQLAKRFPRLKPYEGPGSFEPATLPSLVFASFAPNVATEDALRILAECEQSEDLGAEARLIGIREDVPCPFSEPWKSGYELALRLREKLGLGLYGPIEVAGLMDSLGVLVREVSLSDPRVRAVSFTDEGVRPTVLVNSHPPRTQRDWSRAATLAHELCHLTFDRRVGKRLGIASGAWAPVRFEQRANAFAAMFLLPEPGVSEVFQQSTGQLSDRAKAVATHFGASFRATVEHLANLDLVERFERDELLEYIDENLL